MKFIKISVRSCKVFAGNVRGYRRIVLDLKFKVLVELNNRPRLLHLIYVGLTFAFFFSRRTSGTSVNIKSGYIPASMKLYLNDLCKHVQQAEMSYLLAHLL